MPIRRELRAYYRSEEWARVSAHVRFVVDGGRCRFCGKPHGVRVRRLDDGRWVDPSTARWRDDTGLEAAWPRLEDMVTQRLSLVVLAAAHLDHKPGHDPEWNLASFCGRCHLAYDREHHREQRRITVRMRYAMGDLFLGLYRRVIAA